MADKALVLGVDAYRQFPRLSGCGHDARDVQRLLVETFGFPVENVRVLLDTAVIRRNVDPQLEWLLADAIPGDRRALHFSGHGSSTIDRDGDEDPRDGSDELFCLHDMDFDRPETYLLDDELARWSRRVPAGVELLVTLDACHSGTGTRELRPRRANASCEPGPAGYRGREAHGGVAARSPLAGRPGRSRRQVRYLEPPEALRPRPGHRRARRPELAQVTTAALNHVLLAACAADQTASELDLGGTVRGAFTVALTGVLRARGPGVDRAELIRGVEQVLNDSGCWQTPQLESPAIGGPLFRPREPERDRRSR